MENGNKNSDSVCIPRDEYENLIECRTHIDDVYRYITRCHAINIRCSGKKALGVPLTVLESVSGYIENENYFESLRNGYEERMKKKCE